ncbi:tetratricopeptide repeat protein [Aurantiacibacter suaedae]|uniref:tetratricopeptide repeat protein n=1 Tax=Aurantiacibacter suaedae TaxID=2545755 RepID=UPI0010F4ED8D|nr:tetratricopeptide repeat protein [Aurantiacibacter suaedae]
MIMNEGQKVEMNDAVQAQLRGDWTAAAGLYENLLKQEPEDPVLRGNYGQVLRQLGRDDDALRQYRRAVDGGEAPGAIWFNFGNALFDKEKWVEAAQAFTSAIEHDQGEGQGQVIVPALTQLARCAVKQGEWKEARTRFSDVLRADPENFTAWLEAGNVCRHHGTLEEALACYRKAATVATERYGAHLSLARALEQIGQREEATVAWLRALECPDAGTGSDVHYRIGLGRAERGEWAAAAEAFRHALTAEPEFHKAAIELGDALMQMGVYEDGDHLLSALCEKTLSEEEEIALVGVLMKHKRHAQADVLLRRKVEANPDSWQAHFNLGKLLIEGSWLDEAEQCFARVAELTPDKEKELRVFKAAIAGKRGDVDLALDLYRQLGEEEGPESTFRGSAAMAALYSETLSAGEVCELHKELFAPLAEDVRPVETFRNELSPGAGAAEPSARTRKLRIGYVTADLHGEHPVSLFMRPVFAQHDHDAFEITVYSTSPLTDEMTRRARSRVDRWRDVATISNRRLAELIEADGIDVLVDLNGLTGRHRASVFARRAAPVQATFLGYPSTTGVPNMDWLISDPVTSPPGKHELYNERVMHLPNFVFCYAPEQDYPSPQFGNKHLSRPLTFGSFNNVSKLTPFTVSLWAKAMQAVPDSRLMLKGPSFQDDGGKQRFAGMFAEAGIEADRLEFRGPSGLDDMMAEYGDVDIALDCFPYNGGTTSCQALWMGAPLITLAGDSFVQRMGAGLLTSIGRPEWVAKDEGDFVSIAKELASDRKALLQEKKGLRELMAGAPGSDVKQYTRDLEDALRRMWLDHVQSRA